MKRNQNFRIKVKMKSSEGNMSFLFRAVEFMKFRWRSQNLAKAAQCSPARSSSTFSSSSLSNLAKSSTSRSFSTRGDPR